MNTAYELEPSAAEDDDPISAIRERRGSEVTIIVGRDPTERPAPLYAVAAISYGEGAFKTFYLGVLFPSGVLVAQNWERDMRRQRVHPTAIAFARAWLEEREI